MLVTQLAPADHGGDRVSMYTLGNTVYAVEHELCYRSEIAFTDPSKVVYLYGP